jgi:hypothetical protein
LQKPFSKNKEERFIKTFLYTTQKKENIKMDEQIKIKILKSFDHGLQKQRREIYRKTFGSLRAFGPLSDPFIKTILSTSSKKGTYKKGCSNKNKNSKIK